MRATILIWALVIITFIVISRVCNSEDDRSSQYNNAKRPYIAGAP